MPAYHGPAGWQKTGPSTIAPRPSSADIDVDIDVGDFSDGTAADPSISFQNDDDLGLYRPAADALGIATNGTARGRWVNAGLQFELDGSAASPVLSWTSDTDTGLYRRGANDLALATSGTERFHADANEAVFNEGGNAYDFRVEAVDSANMLVVHGASSPSGSQVSIGTDVNNDWGSLFVSNRDASGAAEIDLVATLGETGGSASASLDGNNTEVWSVALRPPTVTAGAATTVTDAAPLYVDGPIVAGTNVTITNSYLAKIEDDADSDVFTALNDGTVTVDQGPLHNADGSAASPSYTFGADTDTGIFRNGSNQLSLAAGGGEIARVDSGGVFVTDGNGVVVGDTSKDSFATITPESQVLGTAPGNSSIVAARYSNDTGGSFFVFSKSRATSTNSDGVAVQSGDDLGKIFWVGDDGADLNNNVADLFVEVDGSVSTNTVPTRCVFRTTTSGGTLTEALRIDSGQQLRAETDGSASSPVWTFGNDLDTGFYLNAAGDPRFAVGGADSFAYDGEGINALPGTATPGSSTTPVLEMGSNGVGFFVDADGDPTAVDDAGNTQDLIAASSTRYKTDFEPIESTAILDVEPTTFKRNGHREAGIRAEAIAAAGFHEAVHWEPAAGVEASDGYLAEHTYVRDGREVVPKGVDYARCWVYLLPPVKENRERVEQNDDRIEELEAEIERLEGELDDMKATVAEVAS